MRIFSTSFVITGILLCLAVAQSVTAQSLKDIQDYCQSMNGSGMSAEDTKAFLDDCIAEQSSYLEQESQAEQTSAYDDSSSYENSSYEDSSYENTSYEDTSYEDSSYESSFQETQYEQENYGDEQHCYTKVDEQIQKILGNDPNSAFDYDQLLDQCLKGNL